MPTPRVEGDYYVLPHGVKFKTAQALGIDPNDKEQMDAYADFYKHFTNMIYTSDASNNLALGIAGGVAGGAALGALGGAIGGKAGSAGGDTTGDDGGGNDDPSSDNPGGGASGGNGGTDNIATQVLGLIKQYGPTALEGLNIYQSAQNQGKADQYAQNAINGATDAYNAKAPLRALGIAGLQNPGANVPDLSNIRQLSTAGSGNPFAKALPVAGAATGFKAPAAPPTAAPTQGALPLALGPVAQGQPAVPSFTSPGSPYANPATNPKKGVLPVAAS